MGCVSSSASDTPVAVDHDSRLLTAAKNGDLAAACEAVKRGAYIEPKDEDGWTPLHMAARNNHASVAAFLLAGGANAKAKNKGGDTALHIAAREASLSVVKLLLERGADVKSRNNDGKTPPEAIEDESFDSAEKRNDKAATRALLHNPPDDVAAFLSKLSLSAHGFALCSKLGISNTADMTLLTDAMLKDEVPAMKPIERARLLSAATKLAHANAPALVSATSSSCKFAYFLSHFQRNGGGAMLSLKAMLEARGLSCWLDKDGTPNEEGMMQGIADSRVFLLYLTRGVLTRHFCQLELRRALEMRKPIMLLWEKEERGEIWKDDAGKVHSTVASIAELKAEAPRDPMDPTRGEFDDVFNKCVAIQAHFHSVTEFREAMLNMIADVDKNAFVVPSKVVRTREEREQPEIRSMPKNFRMRGS